MFGLTFIRGLTNKSVQEIADMLSLSKQAINQWETGKRPIPEKRLNQLAEILEIPKQYLNKQLSEIEKLEIRKIYLTKESKEIYGVSQLYSINQDIEKENIKNLIINQINSSDLLKDHYKVSSETLADIDSKGAQLLRFVTKYISENSNEEVLDINDFIEELKWNLLWR